MRFFLPLRNYLTPLMLFALGIIAPFRDSVLAQQVGTDDRVDFNIPAQPLDAALAQYFQATGVQLLYDSGLTAGRHSTALRGPFPVRAGLRILLSGTGLSVRYSNANAAIITAPGKETPSTSLVQLGRVFVRERIGAVRIAPVERLAYYQRISGELETFLRTDRRTERLAFNLLLNLRISDEGALSQIQIGRSSGDRKIDRIVTDALGDARVSPPPPLLDQPLRLAVRSVRK